jgi:hypothetical protein
LTINRGYKQAGLIRSDNRGAGIVAKDVKSFSAKKGWTGEEIGRLMIADMVKAYKNALNGEDNELLTDTEKNTYVNMISGKKDIKQYNNFRYIHEYVFMLPMRYSLHEQTAEACFWKLYYILQNASQAESSENDRLNYTPHIVTQKQYDELKKADFEEKMTWGYSVGQLILEAIGYFINLYQNGSETPFDKYIEAAKKQPITNPRVKADYLESRRKGYYKYPNSTNIKDKARDEKVGDLKGKKDNTISARENAFASGGDMTVEQVLKAVRERKRLDESDSHFGSGECVNEPEALEDATLYCALEYIGDFYSSVETGNEQAFYEIEQDFPELYKALWNYLIANKSLAFINDIPREEYVTAESVPMKTLYDNNVLDFKSIVDTFDPMLDLSGYGGGIAIIQESGSSYPKGRIDKDGYYQTPENLRFANHRAEKLIDEYGGYVKKWIDILKSQYKEMYAIHAFLAITSDFIGVEGMEIFISPIDEMKIEALNGLFMDFTCYLCKVRVGANSRAIPQLTAELAELLQPIQLSNLQPSEEAIKQARKAISYDTFKGYASGFISNLKIGGDE